MARVILIPIGSSGDVHPFLGLGSRLRERGNEVIVVTNPKYEPLVRRLELGFRPLGTIEDYNQAVNDPNIWRPIRGFRLAARRAMLHTMEPIFNSLKNLYVPGETVAATQISALGARIAHDKFAIPLVSVLLQPAYIRSVYQSPVLPMMVSSDRAPRFVKRAQHYLIDRLGIDPILARRVNRFRASLGLAPIRRVLNKWWHSPMRNVALFPSWYATPQPDWPDRTVLTGFPLWDEATAVDVPEAVEQFLDDGDPPIVFTPGSAMNQGVDFFAVAVAACQRLGRRGILLSPYRETLPDRLPQGIVHFDYIPFSQVLPRAAALVHHGGIGSAAQAMAAGIPQLIMSMAHDQPDNIVRVKRLGVGSGMPQRRFRTERVVRELSGLLESPDVSHRCHDILKMFENVNPLEDAAVEIERCA